MVFNTTLGILVIPTPVPRLSQLSRESLGTRLDHTITDSTTYQLLSMHLLGCHWALVLHPQWP